MANFYKDNSDLKFQFQHPLMGKIVELKEDNFKDFGKYDYAPANVEDAIDSYDRVMEIIGEICGDVLAPNAEQVDHDGPVYMRFGRLAVPVVFGDDYRYISRVHCSITYKDGKYYECPRHFATIYVKGSDFCSHGKRKDGAE